LVPEPEPKPVEIAHGNAHEKPDEIAHANPDEIAPENPAEPVEPPAIAPPAIAPLVQRFRLSAYQPDDDDGAGRLASRLPEIASGAGGICRNVLTRSMRPAASLSPPGDAEIGWYFPTR
jgi:hypothetical protein